MGFVLFRLAPPVPNTRPAPLGAHPVSGCQVVTSLSSPSLHLPLMHHLSRTESSSSHRTLVLYRLYRVHSFTRLSSCYYYPFTTNSSIFCHITTIFCHITFIALAQLHHKPTARSYSRTSSESFIEKLQNIYQKTCVTQSLRC